MQNDAHVRRWRDVSCRHYGYDQDPVTGECHCRQCGRLLIDSIGRVLA